jgi:hypothetical protein
MPSAHYPREPLSQVHSTTPTADWQRAHSQPVRRRLGRRWEKPMATFGPSTARNEAVRCAVCHGRIMMPAFVILRGVMMCYSCERLQGAEFRDADAA